MRHWFYSCMCIKLWFITLHHYYLNGFLKEINVSVSPTLCVLVQFYYCLSALPLSLCLLSHSFLLGHTPVPGFVIGLCPIISDNRDGFCLCDWIVTELGSSQFSCLVLAKLAATHSESQPPALTVLPFSPDHVFLVQFYCSV